MGARPAERYMTQNLQARMLDKESMSMPRGILAMIATKRSVCWVVLVAVAMACGVAGRGWAGQRSDEPASAREVPTIDCVMASPRACLLGTSKDGAIDYSLMVGGAENFARTARVRTIEIPTGTRVLFLLDRQMEGVWMEGSHGLVETLLTVQWVRAAVGVASVAIARDRGDSGNAGPCLWKTAGSDGAWAIRQGPSIGTARVGVPVRFTRAGLYCLRGIVTTSVKSWRPSVVKAAKDRSTAKTPDTTMLPANLLAIDVDIVHVLVSVVDRPSTGRDGTDDNAQDDPPGDPNDTYTEQMPNVTDPIALGLTGEAGTDDYGVFIGTHQEDFVVPDDE